MLRAPARPLDVFLGELPENACDGETEVRPFVVLFAAGIHN
jgi:hypothetical protein